MPIIDELHKAIAERLDQRRVCAIFIGSDGFRPWHVWEIGVAINLRMISRVFRLIPVILPRESKTKFLPREVLLWLLNRREKPERMHWNPQSFSGVVL